MKVEIIKVHPSWNNLYDNEFTTGDILTIDGKIIIAKSGRKYNVKDLSMSYGYTCKLSDIFKKL